MKPKLVKKSKPTTRKRFAKLTPEQKRVAIARDVIAQIRAGNVEMRASIYHLWKDGPRRRFSKKTLKSKGAKCACCAIGAAIVSGLRLFNGDEILPNYGNAQAALRAAKRWFSPEQAALIEYAFEGSQIIQRNCGSVNVPYKEAEKAYRFWDQHWGEPKPRAIAIFKNIIRHRGTFKP